MMRLTEEQRQLVEDNHNLIYYILRQRNLSFEEYYDLAAIGLCRAAALFDSTKGFKFSTYAVYLINGEINHFMRRQTAAKRTGIIVSLDTPIPECDGLTLGDRIESSESVESHVIVSEIWDRIHAMKPNQRKAAELSYCGFSQENIAGELRESQVNVGRRLKRARRELNELL